jgi:hypothetical protein
LGICEYPRILFQAQNINLSPETVQYLPAFPKTYYGSPKHNEQSS